MCERRFRWYGHIVRSKEDLVARTAIPLDPDGQQPHGRSKKRWMDHIKEDMKYVGVALVDALDLPKWR